jgi:hypothetical protein
MHHRFGGNSGIEFYWACSWTLEPENPTTDSFAMILSLLVEPMAVELHFRHRCQNHRPMGQQQFDEGSGRRATVVYSLPEFQQTTYRFQHSCAGQKKQDWALHIDRFLPKWAHILV